MEAAEKLRNCTEKSSSRHACDQQHEQSRRQHTSLVEASEALLVFFLGLARRWFIMWYRKTERVKKGQITPHRETELFICIVEYVRDTSKHNSDAACPGHLFSIDDIVR